MQQKGFTLVELVIVIVIVGILSIVAVPIYKGYVEKARMTEGKALTSAVRTAQNIYYAEHGTWYSFTETNYNPILNVDARSNKYYKTFLCAEAGAAGAWYAAAVDATGKGARITLYWAMNAGSPVYITNGVRTPCFGYIYPNGDRTYSQS